MTGGIHGDRPKVVWSEGQNACGGPTAVVDRDTGRIWLHMRWNHGADWIPELRMGIGRDSMRAFVCYSDDDGASWSKPRELEDVGNPQWWKYGPGPGVGIQLQTGHYRGRLVIPCFMSGFGKDVGHDGFQYVHDIQGPDCFGSYVIFSDDHGRTWGRSRDVVWPWVNECQVVELADGRLMLNMRNYDKHCQCRGVAVSEDGGNTWSECWHNPALVTPTCQASILRYTREGIHDKNRLLFSNPADSKSRRNMTVKLSYDEGETWPVARTIEPEGSQYSCLTVLPDMKIGLIYERQPYKFISFARFNLKWLSSGKDKIGE
jgi:sialidase-1